MKTIQFFPYQWSGKTHSTFNINAFFQSSSNIQLTTKKNPVHLLSLSFYHIYYITNSSIEFWFKVNKFFKGICTPTECNYGHLFFPSQVCLNNHLFLSPAAQTCRVLSLALEAWAGCWGLQSLPTPSSYILFTMLFCLNMLLIIVC